MQQQKRQAGGGARRASAARAFGALLKTWRARRGLSQSALALDAGISARHLSFLETGRAQPSRDMVLALAEELAVPLRERNVLLDQAGYAPAFAARHLDDPGLATVRAAMEMVLTAHEPFPALIVDRHFNLVSQNSAVAPLLEGVSAQLLITPVSVLRLTLHPDGLSPRIDNLAEWSAHLLHALDLRILASGDPVLQALRRELAGYGPKPGPVETADPARLAVPLRLRVAGRRLSFISTATVFSSALDVTLSELSLETLLPLDQDTARALWALSGLGALGDAL